MVSLYFFIFWEAKLYSDALLQIFFLAINLYGWLHWHRIRHSAGEVLVERMSWRSRFAWLAATLAASLAWGLAMRAFTDAAAPIPDALIAGGSVAAQILLALRRVENWVLWIAVDLIAVPLYWSRGLEPTAGLYALFLALAVAGLVTWSRALHRPLPIR
jgi:nicotinamide mononucleotide transporter